MIRRSMDASFFNRICNMKGVREHLAGKGFLDTTGVVENPANFALKGESGGFIVLSHGSGVYSVHSQFAPEGRSETVPAMRAGFDFMFTRTDAVKIFSHIPDNNKGAQSLGKAAGFRPWFRREDIGGLGPGEMVSLDVDTWIAGNKELEVDGRQFHDALESAKAASGSSQPPHADDVAHDRYVGAVCRMCARGQAKKGIGLYNLWADAAGYQRIELLAENPLLVDVRDAIVGLGLNGEMEVLRCRSG